MTEHRDFDSVDAFTVGAVGRPGQRVFFLQARHGGEWVTIKCEKQQVAAIADHLTRLLHDLPAPSDRPVEAAMQFVDSAILKYKVSGTAFGAAYLSGIIWFAALSLLYGLCSYGSTFVAQFSGDGQPERIGPVVWQGVWLALASAALIPAAQAVAPYVFAACN